MKKGLKLWNSKYFVDLDKQCKDLMVNINELDLKDENANLCEAELTRRRDLVNDFWKMFERNESLVHQKARSK